jgi:hypothetical protein
MMPVWTDKGRLVIAAGVIAVLFISPRILHGAVFHGRDRVTGTLLSRTSVDTITPENGLKVGLKIIRIHGGDKVTLAFTSLDRRLKDLDTSSASLLVDDQSVPLVFSGYHAMKILDGLPPLHELWFAALDPGVVAKVTKCKTLSMQVSTVSGVPIRRTLRTTALSDVKEVLAGAGKDGNREADINNNATRKAVLDDSVQEKKTVTGKPKKGISMATLDTTHFTVNDDPNCGNGKPDYSKYHTIVHLAANAPIGTTERSGKTINVYVVITEGKDESSGEARRLGFSVSKTAKTNMRMGEPGTRISFDGDENDPFEPIPGVRIWDGAVDIDPQCGLVIRAKGAK